MQFIVEAYVVGAVLTVVGLVSSLKDIKCIMIT